MTERIIIEKIILMFIIAVVISILLIKYVFKAKETNRSIIKHIEPGLVPKVINTDLQDKVLDLLKKDEKLTAIKLVVDIAGMGLRDAKDYVESFGVSGVSEPRASIGPKLSEQDEKEVMELIKNGQNIQAIKQVRERTNLGLKDAKDYVDNLAAGTPPKIIFNPAEPIRLSASEEIELLDLVRQGRKIDAIKLVRVKTGAGLKESKDYVETLE